MARADPREDKRSNIAVAVSKYWLAVTAVALLSRLPFYYEWHLLLEACVYLVLILLVVRQKVLESTLAALRPPYRLFLATLVALLLGAQLRGQSDETFPFVEWAMYSQRPAAQPRYYDYTAVLQSGQEVPLEVSRQFPSLSRKLLYHLDRMAPRIAHDPDGPEGQAEIARYESTLRAVAHQYTLRHADDPVRAIRVWQCTIPIEAYRGKNSIARHLFWQVPMNPEDARRVE
jgi:hypothetical protein